MRPSRASYIAVGALCLLLVALFGGRIKQENAAQAAGSHTVQTASSSGSRTAIYRAAEKSDTSRPLNTLQPKRNQSMLQQSEANENPALRKRSLPGVVDNVMQKAFGPFAMPTTIANFDGE